MSNLSQKKWTKPYLPTRSLVLWGWSDSHTPSFLILYGEHQYSSTTTSSLDESPSGKKVGFLGTFFNALLGTTSSKTINSHSSTAASFLDESVTYTHYAIFTGHQGHFPHFESVKIITEQNHKQMYYKKGISYDYYHYKTDSDSIVESFNTLEVPITFSYYSQPPYESYVRELEKHNLVFPHFTLAKHPNDFLSLSGGAFTYYPLVSQIISHPKLYMRKKYLSELLEKNPPAEILELLFNLGSCELISGMCLELAKLKNPILLEAAKAFILNPVNFGSQSYNEGVLRCINIYIQTLDSVQKATRIEAIYKDLPFADLPLICIHNKPVPMGKQFSGAQYASFAYNVSLQKFSSQYNRETRSHSECLRSPFYEVGPYTDGYDLNIIAFKNTLQEAISYDLADVVGKLGYYLDAPRLRFYFKASGKTKAYRYLISTVRRTLDDYATHSPNLFVTAMEALLTSYTPNDYLCKFPGNFQYNYFIRHFLYYDFTQKPPTSWNARYKWFREDQHLKTTNRQDKYKEIWNQHLDTVVSIARRSTIPVIQKACYYILKESPFTMELIRGLSHSQLITLSQSHYKPLAQLFMTHLNDRINSFITSEPSLLLALMDTSYDTIHQLALDKILSNNSLITPAFLAQCFLLTHGESWLEFLTSELLQLTPEQYSDFIVALSHQLLKPTTIVPPLSLALEELLVNSCSKLEQLHLESAKKIMRIIRQVLKDVPALSESLITYFEGLIFSFDYTILETLLEDDIPLNNELPISICQKSILDLLQAIQTRALPSDATFKTILEKGNAPMIKTLIHLLDTFQNELSNRPTLLLLMLECDVIYINELASTVFEKLTNENALLSHQFLLDSPLPKVHQYGLKQLEIRYGDFIPSTFIVQLLEHPHKEVKNFISQKIDNAIANIDTQHVELFMYYVKTLLLLPNKISKGKDALYSLLPAFVSLNPDYKEQVETMLLSIAGSNIKRDSERALMSLAKIRKGTLTYEG